MSYVVNQAEDGRRVSYTSRRLGGGYKRQGGFDIARDRYRVYVVTQATMLAAGWFAGVASRGQYEALLHSGCLVAVCHVVFVGVGLV